MGSPLRGGEPWRGDAENPLLARSGNGSAAASAAAGAGGAAFALPCVFAASLGALCFGYHLSVVNGPLEAITVYATGAAGNLVAQGLVVSTLLMGAAVGSIFGGKMADTLGRSRSLSLTGAALTLGPLICFLLPEVVAAQLKLPALLLGRMVTGAGVGLASSLVPLYISEISPKRLRGSLGSVNQICICLGIVLGFLVNLALDASQWRVMFLLSVAPGAMLAVLARLAMPESPRFLAQRGQNHLAEVSAFQLWGRTEQAQEELRGVLAETEQATNGEEQAANGTGAASSIFEKR